MPSLKGRIVRSVIRKKFNCNPRYCKDPIKQITKLAKKTRYKAPKGYLHEKKEVEGLPIEIIKKENSDSKKVVYVLHGGAYIAGMSDIYRFFAKRYSKAGHDAVVVMPDYRLAPEFKFPAALEDALKCWDWILEQGYKEENIVLVGDSAGGNLTLSLMLKLKELKRKLPKAAVCISPWTDMTASGKSYYDNYKADVMFGAKDEITDEMVDDLLNSEIYSFCGDADRKNPLVSPVFGDFKDFPPMLIIVGEDELLLSDSLTVAEKMKKDGVEITLHTAEGMFHVYPLMDKLIPEAKTAMNMILEFISKHLA